MRGSQKGINILSKRVPVRGLKGPRDYKEIITDTGIEYRSILLGELHRPDGPARITENGAKKEWFLEGLPHREDRPAVVYQKENEGSNTEYWVHGQLHREDGPAKEVIAHGQNARVSLDNKIWCLQEYRQNGQMHRTNGPASIISVDGKARTLEYRQHGEFFREDGPAHISENAVEWFTRPGKLHNENGPARVKYKDGVWKFYYYIEGKIVVFADAKEVYRNPKPGQENMPSIRGPERVKWQKHFEESSEDKRIRSLFTNGKKFDSFDAFV